MKLKHYFLWMLLWSILACRAQDFQVKRDFQTKFTQLNTQDGLSNKQVLDIIQDRYGFIWMATSNGLNRYDGNDFLVFKNMSDDATSISSDLVTSLCEDMDGNLWIGTVFGLNKYDRVQNTFIHYFYDAKNSNSIRNNHIRAVLADEKGFLWIETVDGHLHKMDLKSGEIHYYQHARVHQSYYHYHALFKENDSILWLGGRNQDIHQFNIKTETFKIYRASENGYISGKRANDVSCFFKDSKGQLWVSGLDGTYRFLPEEDRFKLFLKGSNFDIFEDQKHFIWFGGGNGMYRYHPLSNELFHLISDVNNPHSLSSNHVNKMIRDKSGVMWIATNDGVSLYSPKKSNFKHYTHIPGEDQSISGRKVTALAEDNKGKLWIGTANEGLNSFDLSNNTLKQYKAKGLGSKSLISNQISHLYFDQNDYLWISQWSGLGFNRMDPVTEEFEDFVLNRKNTYLDWYHQSLENDQGDLLLAVWGGHGLYGIKNEKQIFQNLGNEMEIIPNENFVSTLNVESDSIIWLGGFNAQVDALVNGKLIHFKDLFGEQRPSYSELMTLQEYQYMDLEVPEFDTIFQIIQLNNRSYFAHKKGCFVYDFALHDFIELFPDDISKKPLLSIASDEQRLYILYPDLIRVFVAASNQWEEHPLERSISLHAQILVNSGHVWISNKNQLFQLNREFKCIDSSSFDHPIVGLQSYDQKGIVFAAGKEIYILKNVNEVRKVDLNMVVLDFKIKEGNIYALSRHMLWGAHWDGSEAIQMRPKISSDRCRVDLNRMIFHELEMKGNRIYMAGNKGYICYDIAAARAHFTREKERHFMQYPVHLLTSIAKAQGRNYWLGTTSTGLAKWNYYDQTLLNYTSNKFDEDAFWGHDVDFIFRDSQNRFWFGADGLNLYVDSLDIFRHFTMQDGLPSNNTKGMAEDDKGRLWINTDQGLSCFSLPELSFVNYTQADGLPDNELSAAIITLSDGRMAFGSNNGFALFHPDSLVANYYIPPVVITELHIHDQRKIMDVNELDTIVLQPSENHITFRFACLDYNSPLDNKYKYQLEGIDEEFIETDAKNRAISYSNLKAGTYIFKLQGSNNNQVWNEHGKALTIIKQPHYYEQWWFFLLGVLGFAFAIMMIIFYRIKELNLQNKATTLEQRFLRSQMNPHFIFNTLGAIQNFIFKNEPIIAATYLSDFSDLVRMILNNSRKEFIALKEEIKTLKQYLELQKLRFDDKFDYELKVDMEIEEGSLFVPPMLAQPFIENSIEHGFIGMKHKGMITLSYNIIEDYIEMLVEDNGQGFEASLKNKRKTKKEHESLATKITKDRINVINKVYKSKIQLEIVDRNRMDIGKTGTRVRILIPLRLKNKQDKL